MAYTGPNPRFASTILTDQVAASVTAPQAGSAKIINRNGVLYTVSSAGTEVLVGGSGSLDAPVDVKNYSVAASVGSSALTLALKTKAGSDATAPNPVSIAFRNATSATGDYVVRSVTAALSVVISSGSTLGHTSAVSTFFYLYAIDNAGTVELAVSTKRFDDGTIVSTTAEGGAGAADSASVMYSTTARTNVACRLLARLSSTQTTAGTWAAVPTQISLGQRFITDQSLGATSGLTLPTGYIGEIVTTVNSGTLALTVGSNFNYNITPGGAGFTIQPGVWSVRGAAGVQYTTSTTNIDRVDMGIGTSSGDNQTGINWYDQYRQKIPTSTSSLYYTFQTPILYLNISSATTYYLKFLSVHSGSNPVCDFSYLEAVRIA